MRRTPEGIAIIGLLAIGIIVACSGESSGAPRCANCGMRIDPTSAWRAGLATAEGEEILFETPKCMLRFLRSERGTGARDPWVIEYYSQERQPASSLFFAIGSDVSGPMGEDLVPIGGRERAESFARDHGGSVLAWQQIDDDVVRTLFSR